jgi:hypothetical protein
MSYEILFITSCCKTLKTNTMSKAYLILNVARLLNDRGIKHHETWLVQHGFSRREARSLLQERPSRVNLDHLERLGVLFGCLPEAMLDVVGVFGNHLDKLRKPKRKPLQDALDGKSQDDIDDLWKGLEGGGEPPEEV